MQTDIVLLDIPSPKPLPTSPNTWKVRLALNYKKLNYRTQWVPTSAIEAVCRPLGIAPTGIKPNGSPHYTLPAIIDRTDPSHPIFLSDSMPIVEYLEKTYPPAPGTELFPGNTLSLQAVFVQFVMGRLMAFIPELAIMAIYHSKSPDEQLDFKQRIETRFGKPIDAIEKQGAEREASFKALEQVFTMLKFAFSKNEDGDFLMGSQVSFADFALFGFLTMIKSASPEEIYPRIISWDGGRWGRYLEGFEGWIAVDK
ncbi:hypothetical protein GALMADRAFT_242980 [Galerina marginata CBS 339.88]|uniref:GST N-terminal domain-containing protein n=1 Tax=Galerina marginata (strain CBS 339.88) TaxID=685588 RepID=A0A067TGS6_GALM3|nr:hypothetical protein GALMADRAFT_242980 [Galerina marginata CBS 339.88]